MRIGPGKDLATLFSAGAIGRLSDAELLAIFARRDDDASSEAAFEALVNRHGPMVLGVCRRMLGDAHAADDAFQAVFLVLARRAPSVRVDDSLGRWLYGVTVRVARRARAVSRLEQTRLRPLDRIDPASPTPSDHPDDLRSTIDEEIARLPSHYRSAVVLCYLEGLSQEQAARRLRCPVRTVESRLRRARERLKPAMVRRGLAPSGETMAAALIRSDLPRSLAILAQKNIAGAVPAAITALSGPTLRSLAMHRILRLGMIVATMGLTGAGLAAGWQATNPPATQQAKPAAPNRPTAPEAADGRIELQVVADANGQPIEGAEIVWGLRINGGKYKESRTITNRDGRASLEWPKHATVNWLQFTARKPGFVPYMVHWDDRQAPFQFPASKGIRLVPGLPIGGVVTDEAGTPIAEAKVTVYAPPTETNSRRVFDLVVTRTDAQGRWRFNDAPAEPSGLFATVQAPRFLSGNAQVTRRRESLTVLKRGFTVKGRVLDIQGEPVEGASVRGGDIFAPEPRTTKTDARGEFVLEGCPPGASVVTVQADRFAPELREVHPEDEPTLELRLGPGHLLRGKVVDREGRPVAGMTVAADTWRGHRSLGFRKVTDREGRFEWAGAPGDVVLYDFFKVGSMSRRRVAMTAAGPEAVVTIDPVLTISGRVTDAETGQPVPAFRVVQGLVFANNPRVHWMMQDAADFAGGRYTIKHAEPYAGYAVRIEAPGYKPAESRIFKPDETAPTFDFALTRATADDLLTGVVLQPDGRPAAGAEVALATPEHPLIFENESFRFGRTNGMSFAKTGPDGRFSFGKPAGVYLLAATSNDGYAEAWPAEFTRSGSLPLKVWGKIKGRARIGRRPAADQTIQLSLRGTRPAGVNAFYQIKTRTDAQGNFTFDRVIPGALQVARVIVTDYGNGMRQHMGGWQEPVDVAPGQAVLTHIGGRGRPVIGRVVVKAPPGVTVDWRRNEPATIQKRPTVNLLGRFLGEDPHRFDRFAAGLDRDGRFRIDDVPPGSYELTVPINAPPAADRPAPLREIGRVRISIEVPKGDDEVPVDLGEIEAEVKRP